MTHHDRPDTRLHGRHLPAGDEATDAARRDMFHTTTDTAHGHIGADALLEALVAEGTEVVFGYPGGVLLPLYDVWGRHPRVRHVLVRHEQCAAHAADGYARASGRVGVCLATSGPGAMNLVTGIANARLDSVPLVAITGNVPVALLGKDGFQEVDITGITLPMTKHNELVRDPGRIAEAIREAFHIARTGRPGPVHIDITKDALAGAAPDGGVPATLDLPGFLPPRTPNGRQLRAAHEAIRTARRPVILAGHGIIIAGASERLRRYAHLANIPVTWTLLGIGAMDERDRLAYGYMGMHGHKHANRAIQSADLLIAIGMRFDDRVTGSVATYAPAARIIHADIDPAEIGKNVVADIPIVGDARLVLDGLERLWGGKPTPARPAYLAELAAWREASARAPWHGSGGAQAGRLSADFVVETIAQVTEHRAVLVADVGQNQMWVALHGGFREPRTHLSSGGLGTMGFALPAAMGAAFAVAGERQVWAIAGDGGFQMTSQELATIAAERLPVRIAVLDNRRLGMIRQWQDLVYAGNFHSSEITGPDFAALAQAYGIRGLRARTPSEARAVIEAMADTDGPVLGWFETASAQNVYPMMPAGGGLSDLLEGPEAGA